jgi:hypothetical protein
MASPGEDTDRGTIHELTTEEAWAMLDKECRRKLGITAHEFAARYNAGEYDDPDDHPEIMGMAMDLEFLQRTSAPR